MIEYIELAAKFISLLSLDDIKKCFQLKNLKQLNMNMYLIGKISRWRLYKRYWIITKTLWIYRTDLSIISWLQLLFVKLRKTSRWSFQLDLKEYWNNQDSNNKLIERIFNDKTIDELYLYKIKKEPE